MRRQRNSLPDNQLPDGWMDGWKDRRAAAHYFSEPRVGSVDSTTCQLQAHILIRSPESGWMIALNCHIWKPNQTLLRGHYSAHLEKDIKIKISTPTCYILMPKSTRRCPKRCKNCYTARVRQGSARALTFRVGSGARFNLSLATKKLQLIGTSPPAAQTPTTHAQEHSTFIFFGWPICGMRAELPDQRRLEKMTRQSCARSHGLSGAPLTSVSNTSSEISP